MNGICLAALVTLLSGVVILAGCAGQVEVRHVAPRASLEGALPQGIAYNIPQTALEFTVQYELQDVGQYPRGPDGKAQKVDPNGAPIVPTNLRQALRFKGVSAITAQKVQSPGLWFVIDPESVQSYYTAVKEGYIQCDERGFLIGVGAQFDDKAAEILHSVVKTALDLVELAAVRGPAEVIEYSKVREYVYKVVLTAADFTWDPNGYWVWQLPPAQVTQAAGKQTSGAESETLGTAAATPEGRLGGIPEQPGFEPTVVGETDTLLRHVDRLEFRLRPMGADPSWLRHFAAAPAVEAQQPQSFRGIVMGVPGEVQVDVVVEGEICERVYACMMPFGGLTRIPFGGKAFSDRVAGLTINAASGALTKYTFSGTAAGEALAKSLEGASAEVLKRLETLETDALSHEIDVLTRRGQLLDARKAYYQKLESYEEFLRSLDPSGPAPPQ